MELHELIEVFEDWLLGMPWTPELLDEQKRVIAQAYAKAFAGDWQRGAFMGVPMPHDDDLPDFWKDVAVGVGQGLGDLPEEIGQMYAVYFSKLAVMGEVVKDKPRALLKAMYEDDPELSKREAAAIERKIARLWPANAFKGGYVRVSPAAPGAHNGAPYLAVRYAGAEAGG